MDATRLQRFLSDSARAATRNEIRELLKLIARPEIISLAGGLPSPEAFPIDDLVESLPRILREHGSVALQYGATEGDVGFRQELIRWLIEREGESFRDLTPDHVLVTTASQQALDLCGRVFVSPGDTVMCGLPSYLGALGAFTACGARLSGVPLDDEGLRTDLLEERLVRLRQRGIRPKFVYTVPDFQNPAGVTMSEYRRHELLAIAREFDLLVIEDSPYRELRYVGESPPTLRELDRDGRVISVFTFSKMLFPGLRLGWMVAHPEIVSRFTVAKQPVDLCTSGLCQLVAREYLRGGRLPEHLDHVRRVYATKREAMLDELDRRIDPAWGVRWTRPEGGLFVWMELPDGLTSQALFDRALEAKVAFVNGSAFHCDGSGVNTLRLNFSYPSVEQLREAVYRLASSIGALIESNPGAIGKAARRSDGPSPELSVPGEHALEHLSWNLALHEVVQ